MPLITLRTKLGVSSESDLIVEVKDETFQYLQTSPSPTIRVSAYFDRDWPEVRASYAELHIDLKEGPCPFESKIGRITPGSRTRKEVKLPGAMFKGEQLTLEVKRTPTLTPDASTSEA